MDNDNKTNPMFSSTDIGSTKSRANNTYFTNIEKASFWQKLSTKYAKYQKNSEAKQKAQSAAFKKKRAAKRQAADLRAMSVNIPIAAENGNPALMNTHYAPRPRAKTRPLTAILLILLMGILIAGIVVAILRPWAPKKAPATSTVSTTQQTPSADFNYGGYELSDFEVAEAAANEGPIYVRGVMAAAGTELYVYVDGTIDPAASAKHMDEVTEEMGIVDTDVLILFELEKARLYASMGQTDEALTILERYKEDKLLLVQLGMYYSAYAMYYQKGGDTATAIEYRDKFDALDIADGMGEEE